MYSGLLCAKLFGVRISLGERFFKSIQTGSEAHPASSVLILLSPWVKRQGSGSGNPLLSGARSSSMGRHILPHTFSVLCYGTAFTFTPLVINKRNYI